MLDIIYKVKVTYRKQNPEAVPPRSTKTYDLPQMFEKIQTVRETYNQNQCPGPGNCRTTKKIC